MRSFASLSTKRNGCEVKREWKQNGEYKEEVKCD